MNLTELPRDVLILICTQYLDLKSIVSLRHTCREFYFKILDRNQFRTIMIQPRSINYRKNESREKMVRKFRKQIEQLEQTIAQLRVCDHCFNCYSSAEYEVCCIPTSMVKSFGRDQSMDWMKCGQCESEGYNRNLRPWLQDKKIILWCDSCNKKFTCNYYSSVDRTPRYVQDYKIKYCINCNILCDSCYFVRKRRLELEQGSCTLC